MIANVDAFGSLVGKKKKPENEGKACIGLKEKGC